MTIYSFREGKYIYMLNRIQYTIHNNSKEKKRKEKNEQKTYNFTQMFSNILRSYKYYVLIFFTFSFYLIF